MSGTLWLTLLAGHLAWSAHLLASYFLATAACAADPAGLPSLRHALTLMATAAALAGAVAAARLKAGGGEQRYAAGLALVLNVIFALAILLAGATGLVLPPCA
jgi:hypothetical protein